MLRKPEKLHSVISLIYTVFIDFGICWTFLALHRKGRKLKQMDEAASQMSDASRLLDSTVDVFQHVLVKVLVSIHSLQIFLKLLFEKKGILHWGIMKNGASRNYLSRNYFSYYLTMNCDFLTYQHGSVMSVNRISTWWISSDTHASGN